MVNPFGKNIIEVILTYAGSDFFRILLTKQSDIVMQIIYTYVKLIVQFYYFSFTQVHSRV